MKQSELVKLIESIVKKQVEKAVNNKITEITQITKALLGENNTQPVAPSLKSVTQTHPRVHGSSLINSSAQEELNERLLNPQGKDNIYKIGADEKYPVDYDPMGLVKDYSAILDESKKRGKNRK